MPYNPEDREYRMTQPFSVCRRAAGDEEGLPELMIAEGYASTFNEFYKLATYYGEEIWEQISSDACDGTDMSDVIMQYDHQGRVFARMSNKTLEVIPDEKGIWMRSYLQGTELGRQIWQEIEGGYTTRMSFAFSVLPEDISYEEEFDDERDIWIVRRTINHIQKIYDVSAVSIPANPSTSIAVQQATRGALEAAREEFLAEKKRVEARKRLLLRTRIIGGLNNAD